ncbi:MAG: SpoIIE family protein phosphatase [Candidatus Hydrogenedentes bacterium]|nr:SpoIIE family protein phosphatase [Candidatus Hydrogenedentota bacterium]
MCLLLLLVGGGLLLAHFYDRTLTVTAMLRDGVEQLMVAGGAAGVMGPPPPLVNLLEKTVATTDVARIAVFKPDGTALATAAQSPFAPPGTDPEVRALVERFLGGPKTKDDYAFFGTDIGIITLLLKPPITPGPRGVLPGRPGPFPGAPPALAETPPSQDVLGALFVHHRTRHAWDLMNRAFGVLKWLFLILVGVALLLSMNLSRRVSRPLHDLVAVVRDFGRGNFARRAPLGAYREIRGLSAAFNAMADDLQRYTKELASETQRRERLEAELRIGAEVQRALLPEKPPAIAGLSFSGWSVPARQVGGDFFDYIALGPDRVGVAIGDATDKGLPAALLVTECSGVLRALARDLPSPEAVLHRVNHALYQRIGDSGRFVTLLFMVVDTRTRALTLASAGHPPALLLRAQNGGIERLTSKDGVPLGVLADGAYRNSPVALYSGDRLFLYSDGVTEARGADGTFFGEQRLCQLLRDSSRVPLDQVLARVRSELETHMQSKEPNDDMTLVAVEVTAQPPPLPT